MREIDDHDELMALCDGDSLCLWAAQGLDGRGRAWASDDGRAVAAGGPRLSARARLAVHGPPDAAASLGRTVLRELGPDYRPFGDRGVIEALVRAVPGLREVKRFGWMATGRVTPHIPADAGRARWLPDADLPEVAELLELTFPDSFAKPGVPGVDGWAGVRDDGGHLMAVAALAWSAPAVGLLAGVAVHPGAQGRGLGREVCAFTVSAGLMKHGAVALMVEEWNHAARHIYERLGLRYRPVGAAAWPS